MDRVGQVFIIRQALRAAGRHHLDPIRHNGRCDGADKLRHSGRYCDGGQWFRELEQPYWSCGDVPMKKLAVILVLLIGLCVNASADIWKWVDAQGKTHFVDTNRAIYTWVDEYGKVYYSDTPEHESAVSVEFMWHSRGSLSHSGPNGSQADAISGI